MTRYRVAILRCSVVLFGVVSVWWVFHMPYDPEAVIRAIPADAVFVSVHERPAGRLNDLSSNHVVRALAVAAGVKDGELDAFGSDRRLRTALRVLAGRRVAVAYVRELPGTHSDAWLFASWIGGYSQCLRWSAQMGIIPGVRHVGGHARSKRRVWSVRMPSSPAGSPEGKGSLPGHLKLSVCFFDGVLMGCVSRIPQGVTLMIEASEGLGHTGSVLDLPPAAGASPLWTSTSPDRGWVGLDGWPPFCLELSQHSPSGIVGRAWGQFELPSRVAPAASAGIEDIGNLIGDIPEAVCVMPSSYAQEALSAVRGSPFARLTGELLAMNAGTNAGQRIFLCMMGGNYRARIKSVLPTSDADGGAGMPVPVFMAGVEIADPAAALESASKTIDSINAEFQSGIVPRSVPAGNRTIIVLEGTREDFYSGLRMSERAAYMIIGRWLVVSSNMDSLSRLAAGFDGRASSPGGASASRWIQGIADGQVSAYFWSDLEAGGATVRDLLVLWRMSLGRTGPDKEKRRALDRAVDWAETARGLNTCELGLSSSGGVFDLRFSIGARQAPVKQ